MSDRYTRQVRLTDVGAAGQARIGAVRAVVSAEGLAGVVAARYLLGAGVGRVAVRDAAIAEAARGIDPGAALAVEGSAPRATPPDLARFGVKTPAAAQVLEGAVSALAILRAALEAPR